MKYYIQSITGDFIQEFHNNCHHCQVVQTLKTSGKKDGKFTHLLDQGYITMAIQYADYFHLGKEWNDKSSLHLMTITLGPKYAIKRLKSWAYFDNMEEKVREKKYLMLFSNLFLDKNTLYKLLSMWKQSFIHYFVKRTTESFANQFSSQDYPRILWYW